MTLPAPSIQAEYSAALVDEWARGGVRHAVVSPGSRSSMLALALLADARIDVHVRLDERSGAFFAIGIALSTGSPVVVVMTSGTAAAEVHAAVVEADLARVPLIIACADRPIELHSVGAPQTIDQSHLYGASVRYFLDLPVAEEATRGLWRSFGSRCVAEATNGPKGPGPVQVNLAYREPMVGPIGTVPPGRADGAPWHEVVRHEGIHLKTTRRFLDAIDGAQRGVLIAGGNTLREEESILAFAEHHGWPVLSDARALRRGSHAALIAHSDQFLRSNDVAIALAPDLIIHLGSPHSSKTLMHWNVAQANTGVPHVYVDPFGTFEDPGRYGSLFLAVDPAELLGVARQQPSLTSPDWLERWQSFDRAAEAAIAEIVDDSSLSEPGIARTVFSCLTDSDTLFCSSSMPIRDIEWFSAPQSLAPRVLANRGANGIDGIVSSVLGSAATTLGRTVGLIGDLAFFHDLSGLVWGTKEEIPTATFVVVDNHGGGIFSFLTYPAVVDDSTFERGFGTPQRQSIAISARGLGCSVTEVDSLHTLRDALDASSTVPGISIIVATTDRDENVALHEEISAAVQRHVALVSRT